MANAHDASLRSASGSGSRDVESLETALRSRLRGEVRFDAGTRALYATDASNYRQVPVGVVLPRDADDIIATIEECRRADVPVLPRGAGTSLAGQGCNVAVVIDTSRYYNAILSVDPARRQARIQPGVVLDRLRDEAERHHLTFAPDPATHRWCAVGGMIGNNSCGVHSVMAGKTDDNVDELDILTYGGLRMRVGPTDPAEIDRIIRDGGPKGEIYARLVRLRDTYADLIRARYPAIPRRVSGYNLDYLLPEHGFHVARALVGSEGTCVTVLEATVRLVPSPPARSLLLLGYGDVYLAGDAVPQVVASGPIGLEGIDQLLVEHTRRKGLNAKGLALLPEGGAWLYVEFGADTLAQAEDQAQRLMNALAGAPGAPSMKLFRDPVETAHAWTVRESALGATSFVPGEAKNWEGWEDAAVPPERLGDYLRAFRKLLAQHGFKGALYGHFGQGCIHTRIDFDLKTTAGIARYRRFVEEAADMVVGFGGSLSGEHGDGQSRAELLPRMFGPELVKAFEEFKAIWDPAFRMNPGKVVRPNRLDADLRLPQYHPSEVATHFSYPVEGSFSNAALRCVGVGKCRKTDTGAMCPSYMVTHDERHSTRGRARLLFEMMQGDIVRGGLQDEAVRDALDLCLSCKSCKTECPVGVDMSTYRAEFFAHYYEHVRRPLRAYAFGFMHVWARLAEYLPWLANLVTQVRPMSTLVKALLGLHPKRRIPPFAARSFRRTFKPVAGNQLRDRVLLWPDTWNNHFHPEVAHAAVEVLEASGFHVEIPREHLCCGRPLYDYGMLDVARRRLERILKSLGPEIEAGVPLVGLEPSCVSVFRDELPNLLPGNALARRLSNQTYLLTEFLHHSGKPVPARFDARTILHPHCHQRAVLRLDDEVAVMKDAGLEVTVLDSGCCGMAGAFGFEREHYEVSMGAGERVLLPAVREALPGTLVVTSGFSCREQIEQATGRRVWHVAEVLREAIRRRPS